MKKIESAFIRSNMVRQKGIAVGRERMPDAEFLRSVRCDHWQNPSNLNNVRHKNISSHSKRIKILLLIFLFPIVILADPSYFNVMKYGAKKDGTTLSTRSIQKAIDACSAYGGGTVYFPAGEYISGTLYLKSNVGLFFDAGAVLRGSTELSNYPVTISKVRSYTDNYTNKCLIYAEDLENISISGKGLIDGSGAFFKVEDIDNDDGLRKKDDFEFYKSRPFLIRMINCKRVAIRDIKLVNSPMWVQHYLLCEDLVIDGITVDSRVNHNNDGIDIDGCSRVRISNCFIKSGDDAIVLKSTTDNSCKNVTITNCFLSSDCNAFKLGTESNGGFKDIVFSNCTISDTRLAGVTLQIVDGGILERVSISNITMKNVGAAIFIRLGDRARPYAEAIPKPGMGKLSDVIIDNIIAENIGETGCSITGLPGYPAEDIRLSNISIEFEGGGTEDLINREIPEHPSAYPEYNMFGPLPSYGFYCRHCKNIRFDNIDLGCKKSERRPAFICEDVEMIQLNGIKSTAYNASPVIRFSGVSNAFIQSCIACKGTDTFLQLKGVENLHITLMGNDLSNCKTPVTGENSSSVFLDSNRMPPAYGLSDGPYANCGIQFIDDRVIKIHTPAGVKAKRNQIIRAIWGSEMIPDRTDVIVTPHTKNPIDQNPVISRVDKLEIPVNAIFAEGVTPVKDLAYLFLPFRRSNRLVIINPGHACTLRQDPETNYRIEPTIIGLLEAGFDVLAVFMPHVSDTTCDLDHCKIINTDLGPGDHPATYGLRFFLEPEIVCLNYLTERTNYKDISMVGLSGGGWTTNLLAAIDERIRYSFSVAGSMPIYYRSGGSIGDIEQFLPEMYRDIAGYPDLYVLGSYGKGRKQVQILNRNDDCCFGQKQHDPERDYSLDLRTFEKSVKERLKALGSIGNYYLVIDETAPNHQISEYALKMIILKELLSKN